MNRGWIAATLSIALVAIPSAPAAQGAQRQTTPDLVVKSAVWRDPKRAYVVAGEDPQISFRAVIKNRGRATAGRSRTRLIFGDKPEREPPFRYIAGPKVSTPELAPGESAVVRATGSGATFFAYDHYYAIVCADHDEVVAETEEANNCLFTSRTLDVIPRGFSGLIKGHHPYLPGVDLSWKANPDLNLDFNPAKSSSGFYVYEPSPPGQTLIYKVSGTDEAGCTYNSGEVDRQLSGVTQLALLFGDSTYPPPETYTAIGDSNAFAAIETTYRCPWPYPPGYLEGTVDIPDRRILVVHTRDRESVLRHSAMEARRQLRAGRCALELEP